MARNNRNGKLSFVYRNGIFWFHSWEGNQLGYCPLTDMVVEMWFDAGEPGECWYSVEDFAVIQPVNAVKLWVLFRHISGN